MNRSLVVLKKSIAQGCHSVLGIFTDSTWIDYPLPEEPGNIFLEILAFTRGSEHSRKQFSCWTRNRFQEQKMFSTIPHMELSNNFAVSFLDFLPRSRQNQLICKYTRTASARSTQFFQIDSTFFLIPFATAVYCMYNLRTCQVIIR